MKVENILTKLEKHVCSVCNGMHIRTISGEPHSVKGGVWVDITLENLREILERIELKDLNYKKSGWKDILEKWKDEGKLDEGDIN